METGIKKTILSSALALAGLLGVTTSSLAADYSATATVTPKSFAGKCPKKFVFKGIITAKKAGRVQYKWIRSDNANAPVKTLNFTAPGSKAISTTWTLGGAALPTYNGWEAIQIIYPHKVTSNRAAFKLRCRSGGVIRPRLPDLTVRLSAPRTAFAGENIGTRAKHR